MPQTKTSNARKEERNLNKNRLNNNMKLGKHVSSKEINTDNVISDLIMLETKDLTRKRKRKSINHDHDLISPKRTKLESNYCNDIMVPLPMKVKFKSIYQKQESGSDDDIKLPAPIRAKKEENKSVLLKLDSMDNKGEKISNKVKRAEEGTKVKSNLRTTHSSENKRSSKSQEIKPGDIHPFVNGRSSSKKDKVTHLPIEEDSDGSFENGPSLQGNLSSHFYSPKEELDSDTNSEDNEKPDQKMQSTLKDSDSHLSAKKYISNRIDLESSLDKRQTTEKANWIQTLQLYKPGVTEQIVDFNLPSLHAKYSLIRVPKNINPSILKNLKCRFDKEVLNSKQYLFQPLTKKPEPMFVSINGPRLLNLEKVIVLQKSVPLLPINNIKVLKRETVSLPDAVKARHPLFGVDYKRKICIEKKIKKKILEAIEKKIHLEKRQKKKKQRVKTNYSLVNDEKNVLDLLNLNH